MQSLRYGLVVEGTGSCGAEGVVVDSRGRGRGLL